MPGDTFTMAQMAAEYRRTEKRIQRAVLQSLRHAAVLSRNQVVQEISATTPYPPVDTGEMARISSWPITPIIRGGQLAGYALEAGTVQADIMELGTKPFWPPLDPLEAWAQRKMRAAAKKTKRKGKKPGGTRVRGFGGAKGLGALAPKPKRKRGTRQPSPDAKKMARAVRYAISQRGIRPRGFYARAGAHFDRFVQQSLQRFVGGLKR